MPQQRRRANFGLPGGKATADIPEQLSAIREDLASGAYQQAAREAVVGDLDLVQG